MRASTMLRLTALLTGLALATAGCGSSGSAGTVPAADGTLLALINRVDAPAFLSDHPGLFVATTTEPGMESISLTSYDPAQPPPAKQEVVGFGHLSADAARLDARVYSIFVLDGKRFYAAEFDEDSRRRIAEEGEWFLGTDRDAYAADRLAAIDALLATAK